MKDMDYLKIVRFGHTDGTQISQKQFWSEHTDVNLSAYQKQHIVENLEVQAQTFLRLNWKRKKSRLRSKGFGVAFRDMESGEWYFIPLYKIAIRAFFMEAEDNEHYLLIYDIRRVA